jgi:hypothetical protein
MNSKEISRATDTIVKVSVMFIFSADGFDNEKEIEVCIFNPKDEKDIIQAIEGRYKSELLILKNTQ